MKINKKGMIKLGIFVFLGLLALAGIVGVVYLIIGVSAQEIPEGESVNYCTKCEVQCDFGNDIECVCSFPPGESDGTVKIEKNDGSFECINPDEVTVDNPLINEEQFPRWSEDGDDDKKCYASAITGQIPPGQTGTPTDYAVLQSPGYLSSSKKCITSGGYELLIEEDGSRESYEAVGNFGHSSEFKCWNEIGDRIDADDNTGNTNDGYSQGGVCNDCKEYETRSDEDVINGCELPQEGYCTKRKYESVADETKPDKFYQGYCATEEDTIVKGLTNVGTYTFFSFLRSDVDGKYKSRWDEVNYFYEGLIGGSGGWDNPRGIDAYSGDFESKARFDGGDQDWDEVINCFVVYRDSGQPFEDVNAKGRCSQRSTWEDVGGV